MTAMPSETSKLRGSIALDPVACTSCLVCIRDCPTKCMTLTAHVEEREVGGRRPTKVNVLDTFEIEFWALHVLRNLRRRLPARFTFLVANSHRK
jgi:NADH-quinone oxidoreductase subunit I